MSSTRSSMNLRVVFSSLFSFLLNKPKQQPNKTYDYTRYVNGRDYVFESVNDLKKGYMTGQGKGIKRGDYIFLKNGSDSCRYQVEEIDYYSNPADMWIALLSEAIVDQPEL
ncbi:hypothetical protein H6G81_08325 [Scytonema hofmannii FACHB-248]|uniref:Uncharacterized protein n=2 Tax=Scytonema hofmannii TaxID=34078 RepID=A0ABR8GMU1_9CYAN|nr:hypothetical protein [[Scytonema hofmanni] UTEX B 1581]MBD2604537.1 hypothetical protein [Scytonema hofmannii FACHB-248]